MFITLFITNENNFKKIKDNKSMLDFCFSIYKSIKSIDYFLICVPENHYEKIKSLSNNKIIFYPVLNSKEETIIYAINDFNKEKLQINDDDKIIIHEVNFANTETRIINDIVSKSFKFNIINTILPFDNTFEIIMKNQSQFLVKNKKEVYLIQSPQLIHYSIYKQIYLGESNDKKISMVNVLGSKYNYDLSDELMLQVFCLNK